jgi:hypothetical protein
MVQKLKEVLDARVAVHVGVRTLAVHARGSRIAIAGACVECRGRLAGASFIVSRMARN